MRGKMTSAMIHSLRYLVSWQDTSRTEFTKVSPTEFSKIAIPLIRQNALSLLTKTTGIVLPVEGKEPDQRDFLEEYLNQRATKDQLKEHLTEMSAAVAAETGQPMVIIIDELDRCRPTFAVELLERVKHLFDVPNLVFVFGINRDELCSSLQSIYGNINADVYLRRFFDMEFTLPEADSKKFSTHLVGRFKLAEFFNSLDESLAVKMHLNDFEAGRRSFSCTLEQSWSISSRYRLLRKVILRGRQEYPGEPITCILCCLGY